MPFNDYISTTTANPNYVGFAHTVGTSAPTTITHTVSFSPNETFYSPNETLYLPFDGGSSSQLWTYPVLPDAQPNLDRELYEELMKPLWEDLAKSLQVKAEQESQEAAEELMAELALLRQVEF
jgi:hypothetical protein